ncbi:MAG: RluA family pseudouridine synthase [Bdellovibrionales bacterium]|nr:RluA family pseudouridine synthase [Bdellovibrionales bacterium]
MDPRIIFEDTHLVVLSKPAGLLSQGEATGDENLVDWLRAYFGRNYVGLVHRLDRNTSGIMVVAKRSKSAERLTRALQEGKLHRSYLAWVQGDLRTPQRWQHKLVKDEQRNVVRVVTSAHPEAKEAVLRAEPVEWTTHQGIPLTLLRLVLETGRSHQIRVQAAHEGFPLVGDVKYGTGKLKPVLLQWGRPALHSSEIAFPHPMTHEEMRFTDPLPRDMKSL